MVTLAFTVISASWLEWFSGLWLWPVSLKPQLFLLVIKQGFNKKGKDFIAGVPYTSSLGLLAAEAGHMFSWILNPVGPQQL